MLRTYIPADNVQQNNSILTKIKNSIFMLKIHFIDPINSM